MSIREYELMHHLVAAGLHHVSEGSNDRSAGYQFLQLVNREQEQLVQTETYWPASSSSRSRSTTLRSSAAGRRPRSACSTSGPTMYVGDRIANCCWPASPG